MLAIYIVAAVLTFVTAAAGDWLEARFVRAVSRDARDEAVRLSVAMYLVSIVGLVALVKVGLWIVVPEVLGLVVGTRLAFRKARA